jgi:hypothetical protein
LLERRPRLGQVLAPQEDVDVARVTHRRFVDLSHPNAHRVAARNRVRNARLFERARGAQQSLLHFFHGSLHALPQGGAGKLY